MLNNLKDLELVACGDDSIILGACVILLKASPSLCRFTIKVNIYILVLLVFFCQAFKHSLKTSSIIFCACIKHYLCAKARTVVNLKLIFIHVADAKYRTYF